MDYFKIEIEDAIRAITGSTKLSVCYNTPNLNHPFCSADNFTRNTLTGEISYLSSQPVNVGSESVEGVDFAARYSFPLMGVKAGVNTSLTYLKSYVVVPYPGGAPITYDGFIGGGNGGFPHWRGLFNFTLDDPKWTASYTVQWIGKATDFNAAPTNIGYKTPDVLLPQHAARLSADAQGHAGGGHRQSVRRGAALHPLLHGRQTPTR